MKSSKDPKDPKVKSLNAIHKQKSQEKKMKTYYCLLYLLVNKGIDFIGPYFSKTTSRTVFFYFDDYSLDRLGNDLPKEEIVKILDSLKNEMNVSQNNYGLEQTKITRALLTLCELVGVSISLIQDKKLSENSFPEIYGIEFNDKIYFLNEFADEIEFENKLKELLSKTKYNKNEYFIQMTSSSNEVKTVEELRQNVTYNVLHFGLRQEMNVSSKKNEFEQMNQTDSNVYEQFIEWNQSHLMKTIEIINNEMIFTVYLKDDNWCFMVDEYGNWNLKQYFIDENNQFNFSN